MAIFTGLAILGGALLNFGLNMYGMKKQEGENRRVEGAQMGLYRQEMGMKRSQFKQGLRQRQREYRGTLAQRQTEHIDNFRLGLETLGLRKDQFAFTKEQFEYEKEENADNKRYGRMWDFTNNLANQLNKAPAMRSNLISAWGARK